MDLSSLRAVVGDGPSESTLRALLERTAGDVAAAANAFFDGSSAELMAAEPASRSSGGASAAGTRGALEVPLHHCEGQRAHCGRILCKLP